jgi:2-polyprenyl-6-hydroxyphenyl methylase/3-demethylubiquinone-9 3-methyltransferase
VKAVDNTIYTRLGERWYAADDDPVALLRAEARLRNPWVAEQVGAAACSVLDVGCGGGFLSNHLASLGHRVTGLDASDEALQVASRHDASRSVTYRQGDALALPFPDATFDVVCAMDFLEHVEDPARAVAEAARVLKPSGRFFFHTFSRNLLAWLIVIKGVEWFVKNTPRDMHVLRLFVNPAELRAACEASGMKVVEMIGVRPALDRHFLQMLMTRVVPPGFTFVHTPSLLLGYSGFARKCESTRAATSSGTSAEMS